MNCYATGHGQDCLTARRWPGKGAASRGPSGRTASYVKPAYAHSLPWTMATSTAASTPRNPRSSAPACGVHQENFLQKWITAKP